MNYYWKVSLAIVMVLNIALAGALFYQNRNTSPLDDTRLGAIGSKLKGELENASKAAREYSDKASQKLSGELNAASAEVKKYKEELNEWRAKMDKKIHEMDKAARK